METSGSFNISFSTAFKINYTLRMITNSYDFYGYSKFTPLYNVSMYTKLAAFAYNTNTSKVWNDNINLSISVNFDHDPFFYAFVEGEDQYSSEKQQSTETTFLSDKSTTDKIKIDIIPVIALIIIYSKFTIRNQKFT